MARLIHPVYKYGNLGFGLHPWKCVRVYVSAKHALCQVVASIVRSTSGFSCSLFAPLGDYCRCHRINKNPGSFTYVQDFETLHEILIQLQTVAKSMYHKISENILVFQYFQLKKSSCLLVLVTFQIQGVSGKYLTLWCTGS